MSISVYCQDFTISKISYFPNKNIVGFDIGYLSKNRTYEYIDIGFPINRNLKGYMNIGCGYLFENDVYISGLLGLYSDGNYGIKPSKSNLYLNVGIEYGFKIDSFVFGVVLTNNCLPNIKIGYCFKYSK